MKFFRKELAYTLVLLLASMSWGLTMAYWSPCKESMSEDLGYTDTLASVFNFLAPCACIFGGPFINLFIGKLGRRLSVFVTALFMFCSWIVLAFVKKSFYWLAFVLRFFLGFAIGSFSTVIPLYITELAPPDVRGAYGTLHQFGISCGASTCYMLGIWLKWKNITIISAIPTGLLSLLIWLVPESPVVARLAQQQQETTGAREPLFQKKFVKPLVVSLLLMFFQQFAGTSAFLANLQGIFEDCNININSSVASLIVGLTGAVAVLITSAIIGFCGRRPAWHISSIGQALALALGACNNQWNWSPVIPVICLIADNFLFSIGLAPIPWFFVPELFPDSVRSTATSIMTAVNWIFASILFYLWDIMQAGLGITWSFATFAIIMVLSLFFGIFMLPEPKGDTMGGDIDDKLEPFSRESYQPVTD
ncbi:major facilitator superfamily transporter [Tritrichomonas foetus]|uniref:Major facilitator superfamily transporter n=1 Tax=Tritrichomonas foetus TaxID=1144522 RepID=A0A1J4KYF2_9EUKA|nr:major facilitator superfamily transporter [Tritrichomonas foetus]|eukprot:OHT16263.1 major facilitator superfamily transporter [Tritrichomonas foetus]